MSEESATSVDDCAAACCEDSNCQTYQWYDDSNVPPSRFSQSYYLQCINNSEDNEVVFLQASGARPGPTAAAQPVAAGLGAETLAVLRR